LFITTVFHRALASFLLQPKDRVVFMVQEYKLLEGKFREKAG
jgi:hypothetical protein